MKKQSQDQTNEQLHIDDAAAAQEEYSLEDIMNEFGGWSKKPEPEKQAQTPPDPQKPPEKTPESRKPEAKVVRFPKGQPIRAEGEPKEPKNPADFKGAHPRGCRAGRKAENLDVSGGARPGARVR